MRGERDFWIWMELDGVGVDLDVGGCGLGDVGESRWGSEVKSCDSGRK